jgi:solute carrier family 34 (sodium-dependent phosphate cotransporter)
MQEQTSVLPKTNPWPTVRVVLFIIASLLVFLFAIDLMIAALQAIGKPTMEMVITAVSNPFTGLFAGLLVTALIQSSSTTTAVVVTLVASGSLSISAAVPIIMGANIGTTITSAVVSLGFLNSKKEFKRAVSAGAYHCFFNLLTALVLFPLEYKYGFLSAVSVSVADGFTTAEASGNLHHGWSLFGGLSHLLMTSMNSSILLAVIAFILLFASILVFRKLLSDLLEAKSPEVFSRFFFNGELRAFMWGLLTTGAIRSSTITTSVVVPIVAKKIVDIKRAAPFIMGANVGTTITAFIAAVLNTNSSAVSIAIAHFLFNAIGVLLFFPIPALKQLPIRLAKALGRSTYENRLIGFAFILLTFFVIPFALIYLSEA